MTSVLPEPGPTALHPAPGELLRPELVIASRQRAGDPELPPATVQAALTASISTNLARYDVIELPAPSLPGWLALDFARQGHRVFSLGTEPAPNQPESLTAVPFTASASDQLAQDAALLAALADLRRSAAIEAAVLIVRDPVWADAAVRARERWGWRVVAESENGTVPPRLERAASVVVASPVADQPIVSSGRPRTPVVSRTRPWPDIDAAVRATFPLATIIVVSYNTLAFTRLCVASILANTEYPNYELILVDNASTDGSADEMERLATLHPHLRVIRNQANLGFGPGNNQGLTIARGDVLVLLNSDTMVPHGWLSRLVHHLADPRLGIIGPATNRTCNEAQIVAPYTTYGDFLAFARARAAGHEGKRHLIRMPMMFCVAWRRDVLDQVGLLDERYETGMFEDEDYALRIKAAGYETAWAEDVYVHHAYHASIGKLLPNGEYITLFRRNQQRFEDKWGICWERHRLPPVMPAAAPAATTDE